VRHTGDTCCTVKITFARCRRTNLSVIVRRCLLPFVPIHDLEERRLETAGRPAGPATGPFAPPWTPNPEEICAPPVGLDDPVPPAAAVPLPDPAVERPPCGDREEAVGMEGVPETETWGVVTLGTDAVAVVAIGVVTEGVDTDGVVNDGAVTDGTVTGGVLTVGGGGVVTVGVVAVVTGGTGTVTLGTVTDGTVGVGTRSASACSARRPTPKSRPSPKTRTRMAAPLTLLQLRCSRFGCAPGTFGNIPREWRR
jgi:hypothetical protein